jgi:anti-sigma-K factor RskA
MDDGTDRPGDDADRDLRALADRVGRDPVAWEQPPATLWSRIAADSEGHTVDISRARSPRRVPWWAYAAVAASIAVAFVAAGVIMNSSDDTTVVATGELEPIGSTGSGSAALVDHDGTLQLRLDTTGVDPGDGFLEVWIIDPDETGLVSLGPVRPDGVYDLPAGIDPRAFPIVDVSVEPFDGDPAHSTESVLRGTLQF